MDYTKDQLVDALQNEYEYLCHDDFDPETDMSMEEHLHWLKSLSTEELIAEISTDEEYTLDDFMDRHRHA